MATLYKENIPYTADNDAVKGWAEGLSIGSILIANIVYNRPGSWSLYNGSISPSNLVRIFDGAPSAMTALYELYTFGGGTDFASLSVTVDPSSLDMSTLIVTADDITPSGHIWEDYSGSPRVTCLDAGNSILSSATPTGTDTVAVHADTDRIIIGGAGASPIFQSPLGIPPFVYVMDRRPLFQGGFATQATTVDPRTNSTEFIGGVKSSAAQPYRLTPAVGSPDSDFLDILQNGRLDYMEETFGQPADLGFRRFHITNIAGHTNMKDEVLNPIQAEFGVPVTSGVTMQPHFGSNPYMCMNNATQTYFLEADQNAGGAGDGLGGDNSCVSFDAPSPFTDTGQPDGILGDSRKAWKFALVQFKANHPEGADPYEMTSYQGYRPLWTDDTMTTPKYDYVTWSASSGANSDSTRSHWTGIGGSPGFCPYPGFDANPNATFNPGYTPVDWPAKMKLFFDPEIAGLRDLGFDGIGLDTGTKVFDAAARKAAGNCTYLPKWNAPDPVDGSGGPEIIDYFNSQGLKPVFEAVGMDQWTDAGEGGDYYLAPEDGRQPLSGYWALFGSWFGIYGTFFDGSTNVVVDTDTYKPVANGGWNIGSRSGGKVICSSSDLHSARIGSTSNANRWNPKASEVHMVFQWKSVATEAVMANGGWDVFKQMMWAAHRAGIIVSAGGSNLASPADPTTTSAMFRQYVLDLADGVYPNPPLAGGQLALTGNLDGVMDVSAPVVTTGNGGAGVTTMTFNNDQSITFVGGFAGINAAYGSGMDYSISIAGVNHTITNYTPVNSSGDVVLAATDFTPNLPSTWDFDDGFGFRSTMSAHVPAEVVRASAERLEDVGSMTIQGSGWLQANASYALRSSDSGTYTPVTSSTYPRLRGLGQGSSTDISVDIDFASAAAAQALLDASDLDNLRCRVTVTEGGSTWVAISDVWSSGVGSTNNNQLRFVLDGPDWDPQPFPETGATQADYLGLDLGWDATSGVKIEIYEPPPSGGGGGGGSFAGGTVNLTMSGGLPNSSQTFSAGDAVFDDTGITKFEENFGVAAKLFFDSAQQRDDFLSEIQTWTMNGVDLSTGVWFTENSGGGGFGLVSTSSGIPAAFAAPGGDFVWT